MRVIVLFFWFILVSSLTVSTARAETLNVCQQEIRYTITEPTPDVSPGLRAFFGVWIGYWKSFPFQGANKVNSALCAGLIVERINQDGTVQAIDFAGPNVDLQVTKPYRLRRTGRISGDLLKLPRDSSIGALYPDDYQLKGPSQLEGTHRGIQTGIFTKR